MRTFLLIAALALVACYLRGVPPTTPAPTLTSRPATFTPIPPPPPIAVVPWSAATASPSPAPTPPSPPAGLARCSASQVLARFDGWVASERHGDVGSLSALVSLAARGSERCWLQGIPSVSLVDASGARLPTSTPAASYAPGSGPEFSQIVALDPAHPLGPPTGYNVSDGWFTVQWRNWCGGPVSPATLAVSLSAGAELRVSVPGMTRLDQAPLEPPPCVDRSAPSTLHASGVGGAPAAAPEPWVPPIALEVTVDRPLAAAAGGVLRYGVVLTNRSPAPLEFTACPAYSQWIPDAMTFAYQRHVLNCAGVGTIGPGERVVFEMERAIPANLPPGEHTLLWGFEPGSGYAGVGKFGLQITSP